MIQSVRAGDCVINSAAEKTERQDKCHLSDHLDFGKGKGKKAIVTLKTKKIAKNTLTHFKNKNETSNVCSLISNIKQRHACKLCS